MNHQFLVGISVFVLCAAPANAGDLLQPFPGPAYGVTRPATPEEQELLSFAKAKGDTPSQYLKVRPGEYIVVVRAMVDISSGLYYVVPKRNTYHLLVGGSAYAVEARAPTEKMRWMLVSSGAMHMSHGWSAYYALVFYREPSVGEPVVQELAQVTLDYTGEDEPEPQEISYSVVDINRDGIEDIALQIKDGKSVTKKQFIVTGDGIHESP